MKILVISIGPVQEFIESARKCRDLWFGSWLLSELARAAAQGVVDAEGLPEAEVLVFPGAKLKDSGRAVANKIVARINRDPREAAQEAERQMRERLTEIRDAAFLKVAPERENRLEFFLQDKAEQQVNLLIEFLWASAEEPTDDVPSKTNRNPYQRAIDEAERLLAAVKNSKGWEQPPWADEGVPKSSLDGIRESVLRESLYDNPKNQSAKKGISDGRRRREFGVHSSERLCGVGLLKRFGSTDSRHTDRPERIFSTSHVASGPFRAGLARMLDGWSLWDRYLTALDRLDTNIAERLDTVPREDPTTGEIDGSVFYEGRLVETLEELGYDERTTDERNIFEQARSGLREFLRKTRPSLGEPSPYYALLLADGDRMGKVISEIKAFPEHRKLSDKLEEFASSTRKTVERHEGALIYAGGDDVMALLPLHTLLCCARKLSDDFAEAMRDWKVTERVNGVDEERSPTLSMGIAVVHHLMPLDEALDLVRKTEKVAKKVKGKNALAITVKKRGGEPVEVAGKWGEIDARLSELILLHRADAVSVKTQYELMDLANRTTDAGPLAGTMARVREAEARRILERKQPRGSTLEIVKKARGSLARLEAFSEPARLGRELYVAHLLSRAIEQANPDEKITEDHPEAHP